MRKLFFAVFYLTVLALCLAADFREKEMPLSGLNLDTAYALEEHGWMVKESFPDVTMQVYYGIVDGLQVGTRLVPWFTGISVPNISARWNIIREKENLPGLAFGGAYGAAVIKKFEIKNSDGQVTDIIDRVDLRYFNVTGYVAKRIGDFFLSGSFTYNNGNVELFDQGSDPVVMNESLVSTLQYYTGKEDPLGMFSSSLVLIWQFTPSFRAVAEGMMLVEAPFAFYAAGGIVWAIGDLFRLEAGVLGVNVMQSKQLLPHLSVYARF